ncbi:hypothetical protein H8B15_06145 [Hymenobacter sp. BT507]|uniref:Outer membrane protein beta-barrel domain-containing protein n=1 Tax=Hymenobacter citatus TaxID=2763506 RepID=A0ABR7MHF6_9BACT|nr:hypothetical protein [Hymenobacter citatus]MBC6610493.1 hypothetical protein [Hymenobacter citatus]
MGQLSTSSKLYWVMCLALLGYGQAAQAQQMPVSRRFTVQVHYGAAGNFFASSFRDTPYELQRVNFLGTAGGGEVSYRVGKAGAVALAYTRSVNMDEKHLSYLTNWGTTQYVDFRLRYVNNAFQAIYERALTPDFKVHAGLLYMTTASQTLYPGPPNSYGAPYTTIDESNMGNNYPEEGGVVAGLEYSRPIDTRLRLGIKARGYYLISVRTFEMLTLTPTLSYSL